MRLFGTISFFFAASNLFLAANALLMEDSLDLEGWGEHIERRDDVTTGVRT